MWRFFDPQCGATIGARRPQLRPAKRAAVCCVHVGGARAHHPLLLRRLHPEPQGAIVSERHAAAAGGAASG
eukprot:SAG11_NODE_17330_length_521_cov_1.715640_1_plen_70_part_01